MSDGDDLLELNFASETEPRASSVPSSDSPVGGETDGNLTDDALVALDKHSAKRLGKPEYKRWKKLHKKLGKSSKKDKKKKKEKKEKKEKKKKEEKEKKEKPSRKRARDDSLPPLPDDFEGDFSLPQDEVHSGSRKRRVSTTDEMKKEKTKKVSSNQLRDQAVSLVAKMRKAAEADEAARKNPSQFGPPLNRIALRDEVECMCSKNTFLPFLLSEGLLALLCDWLVRDNVLAPLELRTTALDLLMRFPMKTTASLDEKEQDRPGVAKEHLVRTEIGRAVNTLRLHADEIPENRKKCGVLLERFSRVFSEMSSERVKASGVVEWKCKGSGTGVASPFAVVPTASEMFQKDFMRPDPRDPTSYHNLLPPRQPVQVVTNVSGRIAERLKEVQDDDDFPLRRFDTL